MKHSFLFLILTLSLGLSPLASAEKMDSETQNMVIGRLERILSQMEKTDSSYVPSRLRLADLLAERARLRFLSEVESDCKACKGSVEDRQRALVIYEEILPKVRPDQQGPILFQTAYLFEMAGEEKKAVSLYESILAAPGKYGADLAEQARLALADRDFQNGRFKEALAHYEILLKKPRLDSRGLILYRAAWCEFNLDRLERGIERLEKLANSPALITKSTPQGPVEDAVFRTDILHDLATFYSRRKISDREIERFLKWTPPAQKKELVRFFAGEADRLGQKQAASRLFKIYLDLPDLTKEERLEGFVQLAQVNYDKGQAAQSTQDFAIAAEAYKNTRCSENEKCVELQKRMKRYVTELHRSKKLKPDLDVLKAYAIYAKTFPDDIEMIILGADVATDIHQPRMAEVFYRHYLDVLPQGPKSYEVRYQLAQLAADRKEWKSAADQFRLLALDSKGPLELRKKSADLALDALAAEKRDADIQSWSQQFAEAFPSQRNEFQGLNRKAVVNEAAARANDPHASKSDLRDSLRKMQNVSLAGATDSEKLLHYRNEAVLAEKIEDEAALLAALDEILSVRSVSAQEREETLARKVGFFEKKQQYEPAYRHALLMKFPHLSPAEKDLRLGTLAELAGLPAQKHYERSLRSGLKGKKSAEVRARLVLIATNPIKELNRQKNELAKFPSILSETLISVFAKTRNLPALEPLLSSPSLKKTPAAVFLRKQPFFEKHQAMEARLAEHELDADSDSRLQKSIRERIRLLNQADASLAEAVKLKDHTAQVMALTTVAKENERMVRDLSSLPMPKGLSRAEQEQYVALLKQQSRPYLVKAKLAQQKLQEIWANQRALDALLKDLQQSRPEVRPLLENEVRILSARAPSYSIRSKLGRVL
jgi:hypothetical protein